MPIRIPTETCADTVEPAASRTTAESAGNSFLIRRQAASPQPFAAERVVPGVEVHEDRDITWVVHDGNAWRNAGIMVRLSTASAARRLDTVRLEHGCEDARRSRMKAMVLLATTDGQRVYLRRGFTEVARFGYWYRSFQRDSC